MTARVFLSALASYEGRETQIKQLSLQQVLKLLLVHWQIRSTWLCISIQSETTEFPWQRLTASWQRESPPMARGTPRLPVWLPVLAPLSADTTPPRLRPPHPRCRVAPPIPHLSGWCWGSPGGVITRENMSALSHTARRDTGRHKTSTNKKPVLIFPARWKLWRGCDAAAFSPGTFLWCVRTTGGWSDGRGAINQLSNIQSFTGSRAYVNDPLVKLKVGDGWSSSFHWPGWPLISI